MVMEGVAASSSNGAEIKTSSNADPMKLKVLAFHGYRQNGHSFRSKTGSLRKAISKYAQMIYITAPHSVKSEEVPNDGDSKDTVDDQRGWWFNAEDNTFNGKSLGGPAIGFEESLKVVEQTVREHGPFDGFFGFSQGACLVGLLAAMQQKGMLPYSFNFAIMASGFCSGSLVHKGFYDDEIHLPSLHVYGETDLVIPKEMSEALINCFDNATTMDHSGGHYVACSGSVKDAYQDFLSEAVKKMEGNNPMRNIYS